MAVTRDFEREYAHATLLHAEFGEELAGMFKRMLVDDGIGVHAVDHRVKSAESAQQKIARPRKGMNDAGPRTLATLTDLLGLRIITYFRDEVDAVAKVIEREFTIDRENSIDKRIALEADRFGYLSLHYIAQLSPSRTALPEYQRYGGIKFEVQIRSILQHAWAEIEHDLGYKSEAAVPRTARRQFSRLAGLLELADDEFVAIRDEIDKYQGAAQDTIGRGGFSIEIDQDSLSAFVQSSPVVARLDKAIARSRRAVVQKNVDKQFLGRQAGQLGDLGFRSIEDLSGYLDQHAALLGRFTERWLELSNEAARMWRVPVPMGITLYYAGALRYADELSNGKSPGEAYSAHNPGLMRQALLEVKQDADPAQS
jgi:putative GTP pyrophosphokinase